MKILLLIPKYLKYAAPTKEVNYHYAFPIGLAYISSVLKKAGKDIDVVNLNHLNGGIEELVNNILNKKKYDVVCSGDFSIGYIVIEKIIKVIKNHESKPKIIIGGSLITSEPKLMCESLNFDFGVIGEGEKTIIELLECLEKNQDPKKVDGICYKDKFGKSVFTKPREPIMDLDVLPFPDYEGFGFEEQLKHVSPMSIFYGYFNSPRMYYILGSRGCPFRCTFCYHSLGDKYRTRSVDSLMGEITFAIERYKINCLCIYDDMFAFNEERIYEFCKKIKKIIKKVPWEFKWFCQLSVRTINKKIVKTMKDSGCEQIGLGFESFSPTVLKSMKKPITPEQIDNAFKISRELKMAVIANFIFGDVAETKETAKETLDYWKKTCAGQINLHFIHPYPGSEIYSHCIKKGIIKDKLDFIKNKIFHTNIVNMTEGMSDKEFEELKKAIYDAKIKYYKYIIPSKIKKVNDKEYELQVKCPYCNELLIYKKVFIDNKFYFIYLLNCRKCKMFFNMVSPLYKFTQRHYVKLDFLRRNYLTLRDKFLRRKL